MSSTEIWKKYGNTNYSVSNFGRVMNINTGLQLKLSLKHPAKSRKKRTTYLTVDISSKKKLVHRLVAELFVSKKDGMNIVNHLDGNTHNNNYLNLEWTNVLGNSRHAILIGLVPSVIPYKYKNNISSMAKLGENNPNSKLSKKDVSIIKYKMRHLSAKKAAEIFGVSRHAVLDIWNRKSWAYV